MEDAMEWKLIRKINAEVMTISRQPSTVQFMKNK
jgi:hypothetical protein